MPPDGPLEDLSLIENRYLLIDSPTRHASIAKVHMLCICNQFGRRVFVGV